MGVSHSHHWPLALLLAAFVALATLYNVANPIFEAPDEPWHYRFVKHLAGGGGLPVLQEDPRQNVAGQEGGQPPLYYALAALATFWIDTSDVEEVVRPNPHGAEARPWLGREDRDLNMFAHGGREDFPYRGTALAVHLARGLSTLMGAATVLLTYLIALEALGRVGAAREPPLLALAAAALVAFIPQFLFISASVNNDNLITALSALVLLLVMRSWNRGATLPNTLLLGAALAAAALAKLSGLTLLPLALLALGLRSWQEGSSAPLRASLLLLPLVAVGAGWWYFRNWALYGDPLGLNLFTISVGGGRQGVGLVKIGEELGPIWLSFWALFGWFNVMADPAYYYFYGAIALLGGLGLVRLAAKSSPESLATFWGHLYASGQSWGVPRQILLICLGLSSGRRRTVALGAPMAAIFLLWLAAYGAPLLQWMRLVSAAQGRLLFPALPAVGILLAVGLGALTPRRYLPALPAALGVTMGGMALLAPFLYIMPAYPRASFLSQAQIQAIPHALGVNYAGQVELLGYRMENRSLGPGQPLVITLYWQALSAPQKNYTVFLHAFDPWGNTLGQVDGLLGGGIYPTSMWQPGEALEETYSIPLEEPGDRPSLVRIEAGLYLFPGLERLPAFDPLGRSLGTSVSIARAKFAAPPPQPPFPVRETPLGDQVLLLGFQGPGTALLPGQALEGRLWWKALDQPRGDYTVFVQLLGPGGLVAQYDAQPRANSYPTSLWEAGEVVEDSFRLSLPQQVKPGVYRLVAGMYDPASGERLKSNGDDHVLLGTVAVGLAAQ